MNLALTLLVISFFGISGQQRMYSNNNPRFVIYHPLQPFVSPLDHYNQGWYSMDIIPQTRRKMRPTGNDNLLERQQFIPLLSSLLQRRTAQTTTVYTTVTSTLMTNSTQSCIAYWQFAPSGFVNTQNFPGTPGGPITASSTLPCLRRKRSAEMVDALQESSSVLIEPSEIIPLEMSVAPQHKLELSPSVEITSSLLDQDLTNYSLRPLNKIIPQHQRFNILSSAVTVKSTITSYVTSVTATIRKSFTVGMSTWVLACLPFGYTVC